jgi:hypothetical protein
MLEIYDDEGRYLEKDLPLEFDGISIKFVTGYYLRENNQFKLSNSI